MTRFFSPLSRLVSYAGAMCTYPGRVSGFFGVSLSRVRELYAEINSSDLVKELSVKKNIRRGFLDFSMLSVLRAPTLYVAARLTQPQVVVETGVAEGFSSSFILAALEKNNKGRLYSIDLPNQPGQVLSKGNTTGWIIPDDLKKRWNLTLGSSKEKLPQLLSSLNAVDMFYHDSDHSREYMLFEFRTVWPYLKKNALLLSDDITDNSAFRDFAREKSLSRTELFKIGLMRK